MPRLELLDGRHRAEVLRFELENREFFARSISDRGDDYFTGFDEGYAELLADQAAGQVYFHVLTDDDASVLGRFNLYAVADGTAEVGYRVAERAGGRGLAKLGVRLLCARARDDHGLKRLTAAASKDNPASLAVLRATGFIPDGELMVGGRPGVQHHLDLPA
jgi:[ribosomal protein S5]-alanine N-acetyltransferase